jgi:subtilisin family serine protease
MGRFREDRILLLPKAGREVELNRWQGGRKHLTKRRFANLGGMALVQLPAGTSVANALREYATSGLVEFAEPDYWIHSWVTTPNDPHYADGSQWPLNNSGQFGSTADADMDAPEAWGLLNNASNIIVAVIDSGVRHTHEDLRGNLWTNPGEIEGNGKDDDGNGYVDDIHGINSIDGNAAPGDPMDDFGHGTHVAGIIGAAGNNGLGLSGVAWKVRIMALKFLDATGNGSTADAIQCLDYARAKGARVVNCSFGSPDYSLAFYNAFNSARSAGIIVVTAAGNVTSDNDATAFYPANFNLDNIVSVAATDSNDLLSYFSNYGATTVDVVAPGSVIFSTIHYSDSAYTYMSGTSMASPHVAGALALVRARFPLENYRQHIKRLLETVDRLPSLTNKCVTSGRVNLHRALANYAIGYTNYAWVDATNHAALSLGDNGISGALKLPFVFNFFGVNRSQFYVGANGLLGFATNGLNSGSNTEVASAALPNAAIYPLWDDLNPGATGASVTYGTNGTVPNRRAVVTWTAVPRNASSATKMTFQALLEETSQRIRFQYREVQPNRTTSGGGGRLATVGIENDTGTISARWLVDGSPFTLTNSQALVFLPVLTDAMQVTPANGLNASGPAGVPFAPLSQIYTLTNSGTAPLPWTASCTEPWLALSATNGTLVLGESTNLTLALTAEAGLLPAGSYHDTVVFSNTASGEGNASRPVTLQVRGTNAVLTVGPATGLSASGFSSGPFSPAIQIFSIINDGDAAFAWAAQADAPWVTLSSTNGTLAPGAVGIVSVGLNPQAASLTTGQYAATVTFLNLFNHNGDTTREVSLTVAERPGMLSVTPATGLTAAGLVNGPFVPAGQGYALTNTGESPLVWGATWSMPWVSVSPTAGRLAPGEGTNVVVGFNDIAANLPIGLHTDQVQLLNLTSAVGNTLLPISLTVQPPPGVLVILPPPGLGATGFAGGPFAFTNTGFQLTNSGGASLAWSARTCPDWLAFSETDGSLAPGETQPLTLSLTEAARVLPAGWQTNVLSFTNHTTVSPAQSFLFELQLQARARLVWANSSPPTLTLTGEPGHRYILETAADLSLWEPLSTNQFDPSGQWQISPDFSPDTNRYYRLRFQPDP